MAGKGSKRKLSENELAVINGVDIIEYYNKHVAAKIADYYNTSIAPNLGYGKRTVTMFELTKGKTSTICPFHKDTDPSFHYSSKLKIFKCFGCGISGDVIQLHMQTQRKYCARELSREEAMKELALEWGIQLKEISKQDELKSVFQRARDAVKKDSYYIPKDTFTLGSFRQMNNRVIKANVSTHQKVLNFAQLDLMLTAELYKE